MRASYMQKSRSTVQPGGGIAGAHQMRAVQRDGLLAVWLQQPGHSLYSAAAPLWSSCQRHKKRPSSSVAPVCQEHCAYRIKGIINSMNDR